VFWNLFEFEICLIKNSTNLRKTAPCFLKPSPLCVPSTLPHPSPPTPPHLTPLPFTHSHTKKLWFFYFIFFIEKFGHLKVSCVSNHGCFDVLQQQKLKISCASETTQTCRIHFLHNLFDFTSSQNFPRFTSQWHSTNYTTNNILAADVNAYHTKLIISNQHNQHRQDVNTTHQHVLVSSSYWKKTCRLRRSPGESSGKKICDLKG
jgi:hypothetical protein